MTDHAKLRAALRAKARQSLTTTVDAQGRTLNAGTPAELDAAPDTSADSYVATRASIRSKVSDSLGRRVDAQGRELAGTDNTNQEG
jgi:hypothetical protein